MKLGDLEIVNLHASGGMAEVYRARVCDDDGVVREYAVKKVLPQFTRDEDILRMFVEEARVAAFVDHECVVRVYDLCTSPTGEYFIVMEFADGKDFSDVIWEASQKRQVVPIGMTLLAAREVLRALDAAWHARDDRGQQLRLIHRDVSPHNVLVTWDGRVKLTDFGIAKVAASAHKTQMGVIKGKFGYMSPEQARGRPLDQRSDLFAVGILLYEGFTGSRLFDGPTDLETLEAMRAAKVPRLPSELQVPLQLEAVMRQALEKDPERRFPTARAFESALSEAARQCGHELRTQECAATMRRLFPTLAQGPVAQGTRQIELTSQLWQPGAAILAGGRASPLHNGGAVDTGGAGSVPVLAGKAARRLGDERDGTVKGAGGARRIDPLPSSPSSPLPSPPPPLPPVLAVMPPPPPVLAPPPSIPVRPTPPPVVPLPLPPPPLPSPVSPRSQPPSTQASTAHAVRPATMVSTMATPPPPLARVGEAPPPPAGLVTAPPPRLHDPKTADVRSADANAGPTPVAAESGFSLLDLPLAQGTGAAVERGAASGPVVADDSATRIGFFPPRARFVGAVCALVGACAGIAGSLVASTPSPSSSRMLVVRTTPAGATVLWDDAPIAAVTPVVFTGPVQDGAHRLTVRLGSSPPISRTIDVAPQDTAVIVDEALEAGHTVRVETWPPGATLELDRRYVGKSPLELTDVSLAAPHTLVASAKGFRPSTTTIDARHPGRQHVVLRLEPHADVALVSVETSLAATVEVDGQPVGVAGPLPLPLGPHTFVVRAPALGIEKKLTATLSSTEPIKLFVSFH